MYLKNFSFYQLLTKYLRINFIKTSVEIILLKLIFKREMAGTG